MITEKKTQVNIISVVLTECPVYKLPPNSSQFLLSQQDSHSPVVNLRSAAASSSSLSNSSLPNSSLPASSASSVPPPSSTSPALHPQASRSLQNHLLPSKDLSPAQQLQQLAAQQRQQHLHGPMQHKQNQPGAKFHPQTQHSHPPAWAQMGGTAQSPIGGAFNMDKPSSPSVYQQDMMFNTVSAQQSSLSVYFS